MCLITFNWMDHPDYKLIVVANRDEFYGRPTESLHQWPTGIYAGKDRKSGGTWMGMHPSGRFAALTNFRDMSNKKEGNISRGLLVSEYLERELEPLEYLKKKLEETDLYAGFNLLAGNRNELFYLSGNSGEIRILEPGLHGLSNADLNTPWPKVIKAKRQLRDLRQISDLDAKDYLNLLQDKHYADEMELPYTGVSPETEKKLSAQFIEMDGNYGTVNTSAILWKHDGRVSFLEKRHHPEGLTAIEFNIP